MINCVWLNTVMEIILFICSPLQDAVGSAVVSNDSARKHVKLEQQKGDQILALPSGVSVCYDDG